MPYPQSNTPQRNTAEYASGAGDKAALWSPGALKRVSIVDITVSSDTDNKITVKIGSTEVYHIRLLADTTVHAPLVMPIEGGYNEDVVINVEVSAAVEVTILGYEVDKPE